jgi:hypothetical protein
LISTGFLHFPPCPQFTAKNLITASFSCRIFRSSERYWMASEMCVVEIDSAPSRSAVVRAFSAQAWLAGKRQGRPRDRSSCGRAAAPSQGKFDEGTRIGTRPTLDTIVKSLAKDCRLALIGTHFQDANYVQLRHCQSDRPGQTPVTELPSRGRSSLGCRCHVAAEGSRRVRGHSTRRSRLVARPPWLG